MDAELVTADNELKRGGKDITTITLLKELET